MSGLHMFLGTPQKTWIDYRLVSCARGGRALLFLEVPRDNFCCNGGYINETEAHLTV